MKLWIPFAISTLLTLSQASSVAQQITSSLPSPAPEDWPFDDAIKVGKAPPVMSPSQLACATQVRSHCDLVGSFREVNMTLFQAQANANTFHNDQISVIDSSDELQLRTKLLSNRTLGKIFPTPPPMQFQQHTHGDHHVLFVANRTPLGNSLKRYHLEGTDVVEVFMQDMGYVPDPAIISRTLKPGLRIHLDVSTMVSPPLTCPNCNHVGTSVLKFWIMDALNSSWTGPGSKDDPDTIPTVPFNPNVKFRADMNLASYLTTTTQFLRRIVVRNASGGIRYYIPLDTGCASLKICVYTSGILHNGDVSTDIVIKDLPPTGADCDKTSLCRLDATQMLNDANINCRRCVVTSTGTTRPDPAK